MRKNLSVQTIATVALITVVMNVCASETNTNIYGFFAQTISYTTANNILGQNDRQISLDYREAAIGLISEFNKNISGAIQIRSRKAGALENGSPEIDHAYISYHEYFGTDGKTEIRLGKVKLPIGLYNETRDAPTTMPSIILPQSIYFDRDRNLANSQYGVRSIVSLKNLDIDISVGKVGAVEKPFEVVLLGSDRPGEYKGDGISWMSNIKYNLPNGKGLVGFTHANATIKYSPNGDLVGAGSNAFDFNILSAKYQFDGFDITAEYSIDSMDRSGYLLPQLNVPGSKREKYYIQVEHFLSDKFSMFARVERAYSDKNDKDGTAQATSMHQPDFMFFSKTTGIGATYHYNKHVQLKAEAYYIDGCNYISTLENPVIANIKRDWNLYMLQGVYAF
jgi:hypothetical protein